MLERIRLEHKTLSSGQHAITSPDLNGFCVVGATGESLADVERQAIEALMLMKDRSSGTSRSVAAIEFEAA